MNQTAEELYRVIGQTVARAAPEGWTHIWVLAEIGEDHGKCEFDYEAPAVSRTWFEPSNQEQYTVYKAFKGIREVMLAAKQPSWRYATFTLERGGKFNLSFQYEQHAQPTVQPDGPASGGPAA